MKKLSFLIVMLLAIGNHNATAESEKTSGARVSEISVSAEIVAIDQESRELSLRTPLGETVNVTASDAIERLEEFAAGDEIVITYISSIEGDLRKPTEQEMQTPWIELDAAAVAGMEELPAGILGRAIQAVCTVEGMNRLLGTVTIMDPRGVAHVIGAVEAEKMAGVLLGDTVIITYTEAVAVALEKAETLESEGSAG
jgi:hypothetical protein